ncbi:nuclear transport factor 2 family protein [Bosea caraganae]|nr:nuclear transport factor 2 family protein [Bosea caraganae]
MPHTPFPPTRRALLGQTAGLAALVASALAPVQARAASPRDVDSVRRFFALMQRKEIEAWGELWAENGRIIVPYPPAGFGTSIDGKAEILRAFRTLFANFESFAAELTGLYPAADSDAVCVEYRVSARLLNGTEYSNSNIAVFRFEAGLISTYHDYFDPRRFQVVVDALPKP